MQLTMPEAVEFFAEFVARHFEWDTHEGAKGMCCDASCAFRDICLSSGVEAEIVPMLQGSDPRTCHVVVRCGDLLVDWTNRQFDAAGDFPRIAPRWSFEADGWRLDLTPDEIERIKIPPAIIH